jgi:hypothetical protein
MKAFYMKHKNAMDILFTYLALCAVIALFMLVWALNEGVEVFGFYFFGAIFGFIQLPFCFKPKRFSVKLIPVYLIVLILIVAFINYLQGGLGGELAALILVIGALILAIGAVVAWLTFAICHIQMKKEKV